LAEDWCELRAGVIEIWMTLRRSLSMGHGYLDWGGIKEAGS